jgi:hypothetical protein
MAPEVVIIPAHMARAHTAIILRRYMMGLLGMTTVADMSDRWLASQKWMSVEIGCTPADGMIAARSK